MNVANNIKLARRYAQAFLNVYGHEVTPTVQEHVRELKNFLSTHNRILFFLTIPTIDNAVKLRGLTFLCEKFELPHAMKICMFLLLTSKRAHLLEQVLDFIDILYKKEHDISSFVVSSSHQLSAQDKECLQHFLKKQIGHTIQSTYIIDKSLIAGIRMCSSTHLWEHSIAEQLRSVQLLLVR